MKFVFCYLAVWDEVHDSMKVISLLEMLFCYFEVLKFWHGLMLLWFTGLMNVTKEVMAAYFLMPIYPSPEKGS